MFKFGSALIVLWTSVWAQQYTITTFAGNGTAGSTGDSGNAASAELSAPSGVAVDSLGNLYIVDAGNSRIRMVSNGTITTVAGNGTLGYAGDGSAATSALLYSPSRVAVDSNRNIYFSDSGNNVVRMFSVGGNMSTAIGFLCADYLTQGCASGYLGDGGPANAAVLNSPLGVAVDAAGNLYVADSGNNVIRKVSGGTINTFGVLHLNHPDDVALDSAQNLYVADTNNNRIVRLSPAGSSTIIAGTSFSNFSGDGGPANRAQLSFPGGVAVDGAGNVYIADTFNGRVRKVTTDGIISTIAGNGQVGYSGDGGSAINASLYFPRSVAVDSTGNVYVADTGNNVVRLLSSPAAVISTNGVVNAASFATHISPGALATVFGSNFGSSKTGGSVPYPTSLAGITVNVGGQNAPVLYVTPNQVNFQVPWEVGPGTANVTVTVNGTASNTVTVPVLPAGPGLFTQSGGAAVVQNADYTLNGTGNPAAAGSAIIAYLTGSGPLNATVADGAATPGTGLIQATSQVTATIGSQQAQVIFAGLAPNFVGLVQVNILVPPGLATGNYPLVITIGSDASNAAPVSIK